ncbi:MAG: NPCBM/NEW2 domain-containing protein [Tepidisphaeraceae bacterium]
MIVKMPKVPELPPLPPKPTVSLTSLTPVEARTGYGKVMTNTSVEGKPLTLGGTVYTNGLGVHAESTLVYEVKPEYRRFVAVAGIDDEKKDSVASVVFKVIAEMDGQTKELAASPKLRAQRQPARWHFDVAIPGQCKRLRLVVEDAGDGINSDHADWVDAGFVTGKR